MDQDAVDTDIWAALREDADALFCAEETEISAELGTADTPTDITPERRITEPFIQPAGWYAPAVVRFKCPEPVPSVYEKLAAAMSGFALAMMAGGVAMWSQPIWPV